MEKLELKINEYFNGEKITEISENDFKTSSNIIDVVVGKFVNAKRTLIYNKQGILNGFGYDYGN